MKKCDMSKRCKICSNYSPTIEHRDMNYCLSGKAGFNNENTIGNTSKSKTNSINR